MNDALTHRNDTMIEANRRRFEETKKRIAQKLRDLAGDIEQVPTRKADGTFRPPAAALGEITGTVLSGVANLRLDSLAIWADAIYETELYKAQHPEATDADTRGDGPA